MSTVRTLTASEAKASLGEVLGTLVSAGPVEITRNGRPVALISALVQEAPAAQPSPLPQMATLYAAGKLGWHEIEQTTGAAFGDLLFELARQGLNLPMVEAQRRPEQTRLFTAMLRQAAK